MHKLNTPRVNKETGLVMASVREEEKKERFKSEPLRGSGPGEGSSWIGSIA